MIEVNINDKFGKMNDAIVDETMLADTEEVKGLALLRDIVESTSKNGSDILRLYCMGKNGGIFQCNLMIYKKGSTTSEDLLEFKNKVIYIEGITNVFKNMFIVDLKEPPISYPNNDVKPLDFFTPLPNRLKELDIFEKVLQFIEEDDELSTFVQNYRTLNITSVLKQGLLDTIVTYAGDALKLINTLCGTTRSLCSDLDERTLRETLWVEIVYVSLDNYLNSRLRVNKALITNETTKNLIEYNRMLSTHKLLNEKLSVEFFNIYECLALNKKPLTLVSKLMYGLLPSLMDSIQATRLDSKIKSGNKLNILGIEHIKI